MRSDNTRVSQRPQEGVEPPAGLGLRSLLAFCTAVTVAFISVGLTRPLVALYADQLGASPTVLGAVVSSYAVLPLFLAVVAGACTDRYGAGTMILFGVLGMGLATLAVALHPRLWVLVLSQSLAGLFHLCILSKLSIANEERSVCSLI